MQQKFGEICGSHGKYYAAVFWNGAPCILVDIYRRSEELTASIIRVMFIKSGAITSA
jgi:hypothetical protein